MNILVTGGAGYIGSHTALYLAEAGHTPIVLDNLSNGYERAVQWGPLEKGDLADVGFLRRVFEKYNIDAVVHFAAFAYVGDSMTDPRGYFQNNTVNTLNLLNAMLDAGVKTLVFSSTCATYGVPQGAVISEKHPQAPINPYGESKLMVEKMLKWYGDAYGLKSVALRYFNAAGADPKGRIGETHSPETHLIPIIMEAASGKRSHIALFGTDYPTPDGTAVRDYIHVNDLADAHHRALQYLIKGGASAAFNLGTGVGQSVRQVIAAVENVSGRTVPIKESPRRPGDPPELIADASLARQTLGWAPQYADIQTIVQHAWHWHTRDGNR